MNLGTKIYTLIYGNYVGNDEFGNQYYCNSWDVILANQREANLTGVDFTGAKLKRVDLRGTGLSIAKLHSSFECSN